jgi:lysophospholipase L1-like esterase
MMKKVKIAVAIILIGALSIALYVGNIIRKIESPDPLVWESDIQEFRDTDLKDNIPNLPVVFAGSSSIAQYSELEKLMQPLHIIKRGFGGASVSDISYYQHEIIDQYKPSKIIVYVGAIDIYYLNQGKPEIVAESVIKLLSEIHKNNPTAGIYYIAIRPSPFQPEMWADIDSVNSAIKKMTRNMTEITYINANHVVEDTNGNLIKDIYKFDRTHLNDHGNALWWGEIKRQMFINQN